MSSVPKSYPTYKALCQCSHLALELAPWKRDFFKPPDISAFHAYAIYCFHISYSLSSLGSLRVMFATQNHSKHLAQCMEQSINTCQMRKQIIICPEKCVEHPGTMQSIESITMNKASEILPSGSSRSDGEGSPRTQQATAVTWYALWSDEMIVEQKKSHAQSPVKSLGIQDEISLPPFKARMTNSNVNRARWVTLIINRGEHGEYWPEESTFDLQPESYSAPVNHSHTGLNTGPVSPYLFLF